MSSWRDRYGHAIELIYEHRANNIKQYEISRSSLPPGSTYKTLIEKEHEYAYNIINELLKQKKIQ